MFSDGPSRDSSSWTAAAAVCPASITCSPSADDEPLNVYDRARLATGLIVYPIICAVGLTGNTLALVVLSRPKMTP